MQIKPLRRTTGSALALLSAFLATTPGSVATAAESAPPIPCEAIERVGTATMSADGAITLRLHALWPQPYSESEYTYAPGDPHYGFIKRHLGGIAPGETKPVPPLCGMNSEP